MNNKEKYSIQDLIKIVADLRGPDGCPWDRKQTHQSIRKNLIEETYEVVEAIDTENTELLKEELGDLLLQVIMHSQMENEQKSFDFSDVCDQLCRKLVFRHPHVFGDKRVNNELEALSTWEEMKKMEKKQTTTTQTLDQVSKALPSLMYSRKVQKRAANIGFDHENIEEAFKSIYSELEELRAAIGKRDDLNIYEELGDSLFSVVNLSRFLSIDPEQSLYDSTAKFISRFSQMEMLATQRGIDFAEADLIILNRLWEEAKNIQNQQNFGGIINDKS